MVAGGTDDDQDPAGVSNLSPPPKDELGDNKKPAAVFTLSPPSEDKLDQNKKSAAVTKPSPPSDDESDKERKPAAVSRPPPPSEHDLFGDSDADPEHLSLPAVGAVVDVDVDPPPAAQPSGAGEAIIDIPTRYLDAKNIIKPRNTSKSMFDM